MACRRNVAMRIFASIETSVPQVFLSVPADPYFVVELVNPDVTSPSGAAGQKVKPRRLEAMPHGKNTDH